MNAYPIRDNLSLLITAATNANPIVVTTESAHQLATGDLVTITGVKGNLNANGKDLAMTVASATTLTLTGRKGSGDYEGGGRVITSGARARTYAAVTAAEGTVWRLSGVAQADLFNLYVDAANDPTGANEEVDVAVYGRCDDNSDWFLVAQIDELTAGWAVVGSGRYVNTSVDLGVHPQLRIDVVASAGSNNNVRAWIAV